MPESDQLTLQVSRGDNGDYIVWISDIVEAIQARDNVKVLPLDDEHPAYIRLQTQPSFSQGKSTGPMGLSALNTIRKYLGTRTYPKILAKLSRKGYHIKP